MKQTTKDLIISNSIANNYNEAIDEFILIKTFKYNEDDEQLVGYCICNQKIKNIYIYQNINNNNLLALGDGCRSDLKNNKFKNFNYNEIEKKNNNIIGRTSNIDLNCNYNNYDDFIFDLDELKIDLCNICKTVLPAYNKFKTCLECYKVKKYGPTITKECDTCGNLIQGNNNIVSCKFCYIIKKYFEYNKIKLRYSDDSEFRKERLKRIKKNIKKTKYKYIIKKLKDHKGTLKVYLKTNDKFIYTTNFISVLDNYIYELWQDENETEIEIYLNKKLVS